MSAAAETIALSARVRRIKTSPSLVARDRVKQLQAQGRDIIDLTAGEPDFDTPRHVAAAVIAALEAGDTRYTPVNGTPALRKAIIGKLERENGVRYGMNQVAVGGGAKQVIYNALAATVGEGDEVIIPAPYWVSYPDMVRAFDGAPVVVPCGENTGFKLSAEAFEQAVTPRTRRGSESGLFGLHKARGNCRPVRVGFRFEERPVREAASLPGSSSLVLKRSQTEQGQPVRMALAGHQLARALALALGTAAAHEAPMVQEESQQIQVRVAQVTA